MYYNCMIYDKNYTILQHTVLKIPKKGVMKIIQFFKILKTCIYYIALNVLNIFKKRKQYKLKN